MTIMTDSPEIIDVLPGLHPGEVLREDFMVPLGLSAGKIAKACGVPRTRIERIATERLGITGIPRYASGGFSAPAQNSG
jgi:hypothetical protein